MKTIWNDIPGLQGFYSASNTGFVRRNAGIVKGKDGRTMNISEKVLKPSQRDHGYLSVNICINAKQKPTFVHRLVALAFLDNPESKPFINHLDNNPDNNNIGNLEWCTQKENMQHSLKQGRMSIPTSATTDPQKLVEIRLLVSQGVSKREISRRLNVCRNTITKYC